MTIKHVFFTTSESSKFQPPLNFFARSNHNLFDLLSPSTSVPWTERENSNELQIQVTIEHILMINILSDSTCCFNLHLLPSDFVSILNPSAYSIRGAELCPSATTHIFAGI